MKKQLCVLAVFGASLVVGVSPGQAWTHCDTDHPEKDCPKKTTTTTAPTTTTTAPHVTTTTPTTATVVTLPEATTTTTTAPTTTTPATVGGVSAELPRTGSPNRGVVVFGLALPVAGGALILGARRRRRA